MRANVCIISLEGAAWLNKITIASGGRVMEERK